jgi:membrane protease YdiL (CAAX protease family)
MATAQLELEAAPPSAVALGAPPLSRRERWIDLALVLAVALWRPLLTSTMEFIRPRSTPTAHSDLGIWYSLLEEAVGLSILAYVLWKRRAGLTAITKSLRWSDLGIGILLFAVVSESDRLVWVLINGGWSAFHGHPSARVPVASMLGMHWSVAWVLFSFVNPWFEELIVRGFLMTEVAALFGMRTAIIASTLIQTSYHLYQGGVNAAMIGVGFLIFSLYYADSRRLGPVIVTHTMQDVWPLLAMALR